MLLRPDQLAVTPVLNISACEDFHSVLRNGILMTILEDKPCLNEFNQYQHWPKIWEIQTLDLKRKWIFFFFFILLRYPVTKCKGLETIAVVKL